MNNIYRGMSVFKANFHHDIYIYILAKSDTNNLRRSLSYPKILLPSIEKYSHEVKMVNMNYHH